MYVVTVRFQIERKHRDTFMEAMLLNARLSRETEPGCQRFDVCEAEAGAVFLYEIYDNEAAFDAHRQTAHFAEFEAAIAPMQPEKAVAIYELVS